MKAWIKRRLAVRCWQCLKWLTSKADGCYGWRVFIECLHQTIVILSIQDVDQTVPASCGQQLQTWQREDNLITCRINSCAQIVFTNTDTRTLTSFWFTVFQTKDLSIVGLHFQNFLHTTELMNPAEHKFTFLFRMEVRWPQSVITLSLSLLVPPQHPVAITRCQVTAIWTHADGPDARPAFCCLSIPWFVCICICCAFWIQQGTGVPIYVDYIQEILQSNDGWRSNPSMGECVLLKCQHFLMNEEQWYFKTHTAEDVLRMSPTGHAPQSDGVISWATKERTWWQTTV